MKYKLYLKDVPVFEVNSLNELEEEIYKWAKEHNPKLPDLNKWKENIELKLGGSLIEALKERGLLQRVT